MTIPVTGTPTATAIAETFFDLTTGKCTLPGGGPARDGYELTGNVVATTEVYCKVIMNNANTCNTVKPTSTSNTGILLRTCELDTLLSSGPAFNTAKYFYDAATVSKCDLTKSNILHAITCSGSGKYLSETSLATFTGLSFDKRVSCVGAVEPKLCPEGSTFQDIGDLRGLCKINVSQETPVCPSGYTRGTADLGDETTDNPLNWCLAPVVQSMCNMFPGLIPGTGDDEGKCVINPTFETVPQPEGYTRDDANSRFTLTPTATTPGLCKNGVDNDSYVYDATEGKCALVSKTPKCFTGYTLSDKKLKIGSADSSYYCTYVPQQKDCNAYYTFYPEEKMCMHPVNAGETAPLSDLVAPNCPFGFTFNETLGICYDALADYYCPVGSGLTGDDNNECAIADATPKCPGLGDFSTGFKLCIADYNDALCATLGSDKFVYRDKKCALADEVEPLCPGSTVYSTEIHDDFKRCAIEIDWRFCPMNSEADYPWYDGNPYSVNAATAALAIGPSDYGKEVDDDDEQITKCHLREGVNTNHGKSFAKPACSIVDKTPIFPASDLINRCEI
jgi:hypothetical protein